ncbi:hypothetical protein STVA_37850 [Allostella vacuolata]|nr:hypothetical protein STVA_37850 [Stella vacuolata]
MFDIGWSELAVIAVVALVVIGPKDLPRVLRTVGQWIARARAVARDFQSSVDEMAREADLQDVKKQLDELRSTNVSELIEKHIDPKGEMRQAFEPPKELSHDPFSGDNGRPTPYVPPPAETVADTPTGAPAADDTPAIAAIPDVVPPPTDAPPAEPPPTEPPTAPKPPAGAA